MPQATRTSAIQTTCRKDKHAASSRFVDSTAFENLSGVQCRQRRSKTMSQRRRYVFLFFMALHVMMALAKGAHSTNAPLPAFHQARRRYKHHLTDERRLIATASGLNFRGGGSGSSTLPSQLDPVSSSGARLAAVWQNKMLPRLQSWKQQISANVYVMKGEEYDDSKTATSGTYSNTNHRLPATSNDSTAFSMSSLLLPSRVFKLTLLALLLAEGLDRIGILYEDAPALLKSRLDLFWYCNLQPKLIRWKERAQLFYWNQIESMPPNSFYNTLLSAFSLSFLSTTKVAFAMGATIGMIASPLLAQGATTYWRPLVAIYGLAEINHYCTRKGHKFVQWLGETPQTLGATLDGILNQMRNLVRRFVLGDRHVDEYGGFHGMTLRSRLQYTENSRLPLLGGGEDNTNTTRRSTKSTPHHEGDGDDSDFQILLDDFKEWMVANVQQRYQEPSVLLPSRLSTDVVAEERRQFATKGFLIGCGLGLAFFRL
jgi:hypothetical protein